MRSGKVSCEPPSAITRADARNDRPLPRRESCPTRFKRSLPTISVRASCCRSIQVPNVSAPGRSTVSLHHDDAIGMAGEHLAGVAHAVEPVGHARDGRIEIERALVVGDLAFVIEVEAQVGEALVRLEPPWLPHQLALGQRVGLARLAGEEQAPHFGKCRARLGIVGVARTAHPQRLFVELDALAIHRAEHHRAHPAVAHGKRVVPLRGRGTQPDRVVARGVPRSCAGRRRLAVTAIATSEKKRAHQRGG